MNIVDSQLRLVMAPTSIKQFDKYKEIPEMRESFDEASLYIIGKRPVQKVRIVSDDAEVESYLQSPDYIGDSLSAEEKVQYEESINQLIEMIKKKELILIEISQVGTNNVFKGLYKFSKDSIYENMDALNISFEELLFISSIGLGKFFTRENINPLLTYEVLYVGHCVGEKLTKRFKAHHALQKMLINEQVISKDYINSDELVILPFCSKADTLSVLTGDSSEEDFKKAFLNNFSYGMREVYLDCEKALVKGMSPKYNRIKFKNYPKSSDGLYNGEADAFCYTICDNIILKYHEGEIIGAADGALASKIVGDKQEKSLTIYKPGDNYTQKYAKNISHRELREASQSK